MKRITSYLLSISVCAGFLLTGCKKKDTTPSNQTANVSTTQLFNYSDSYGIFAGVNTVTTQSVPVIGNVQVNTGTAVAAVSNTAGGTTYQNIGTVQCNSNGLTAQSNNSYIFQPTQSNPTGIDFGSGSDWNISGGNGISGFTHSFYSFPGTPTITSNTDEVTLANGYTFTISSTSADSILFILASGNNFVQKRVGGGTTSVTFSASDLSSLQPSQYGLLQVTPYRYEANTSVIPGKKVYFINQVTVSDFAQFK